MSKVVAKSDGTKVTNPYREQSSYWTIVEVLRTLGIGKFHNADALVKQFPKTMGTENFKAFKAKDMRNENGKDCEGRIIQNALVVFRPDYGAPLREIGFEVRKERDDKGYSFGLFKIAPQTAPKATVKASKAKTKAVTPSKGKTPQKANKTAPKAAKKASKAK